MKDHKDVIGARAPMMIWDDEVNLDWTEEERTMLNQFDDECFERKLVETLSSGVHLRPYIGSETALIMLWEFMHLDIDANDPPEISSQSFEVFGAPSVSNSACEITRVWWHE